MTDYERANELQTELDALKRILTDPSAVWVNMLAGTIARPRALDHYEECKADLEAAKLKNKELDEHGDALITQLDDMSSGFTLAKQERDELKAALETIERQNAAMREALKLIMEYAPGKTKAFSKVYYKVFEVAKNTLATDAGRNYIPREDVEPLVSTMEKIAAGTSEWPSKDAVKVWSEWNAKHLEAAK